MSEETLLSTTLAGITASLVESYVLYPLEYLKVREQIAIRPHTMTQKFSIPNFSNVFWSGSSAFAIGNATKAVVRFNVYNWATKFMLDNSKDKVASAPQVVVAGMITGVAETLIVVPFENIKTTMIEASATGKGQALGALAVPGSLGTAAVGRDPAPAATATSAASESRPQQAARQSAEPAQDPNQGRKIRPAATTPKLVNQGLHEVVESRGLADTLKQMYQQRGLRAFVQGFNPTVIRQIANSGIRFTTYNSLRQILVPNQERNVPLVGTVALAGATSFVEAFVTQPVDVVKTRMQTTNGIKLYGNSLLCSYRIFTEEGPKRLWAGLVPRWLRVWVSGGIIFVVYENSNRLFSSGLSENPFSWK